VAILPDGLQVSIGATVSATTRPPERRNILDRLALYIQRMICRLKGHDDELRKDFELAEIFMRCRRCTRRTTGIRIAKKRR
jgi:hypothetical protein